MESATELNERYIFFSLLFFLPLGYSSGRVMQLELPSLVAAFVVTELISASDLSSFYLDPCKSHCCGLLRDIEMQRYTACP